MPYDEYQSHPPRISTWVIDSYTELAEVLRVVQGDGEHRYWYNRVSGAPAESRIEELPKNLLEVELDPDDPELYFYEQYSGQRVNVATGSCCVTTSSNGSAYISMHRLQTWALPSFLFHPELRPLI